MNTYNKNAFYSIIFFGLSIISLFNLTFQSNKEITPDRESVENFNRFITQLTQHKWMYPSFDIAYYTILLLPFLLMLLSIYFGIKSLKNHNLTESKSRIFIIIILTISIFIFITLLLSALFL